MRSSKDWLDPYNPYRNDIEGFARAISAEVDWRGLPVIVEWATGPIQRLIGIFLRPQGDELVIIVSAKTEIRGERFRRAKRSAYPLPLAQSLTDILQTARLEAESFQVASLLPWKWPD